jgi:hypothetical protein
MPHEPTWTVGDEDGPLSFGNITDVGRLDDGRVIVLDQLSSRLWMLDSEGRLVGSVGGAGGGPGRFSIPVAVSMAGDTLLVLDQGASKVNVFATSADSLRHVTEFSLPGLFHDLCVLDSRIFVLGLWRGMAVHEVTRAGEFLNSFDPVPAADRGDFVAQEEQGFQASGRLECDSRSRLIVVAPTMRGTVRAFNAQGELHWRVAIPEFFEARLRPTGTGYRMSPDEATGRVTQTETLGRWSDGLWVQVREIDPKGGRDPGELRSWSIEPSTGRVIRLPELPRILLVDESWIFAEPGDIVPRLSASRVSRE